MIGFRPSPDACCIFADATVRRWAVMKEHSLLHGELDHGRALFIPAGEDFLNCLPFSFPHGCGCKVACSARDRCLDWERSRWRRNKPAAV